MKLWTMQPAEVYDIIMNDGTFVCDPSKVPEPSFVDRYDFLINKLRERDPSSPNIQYPIWAWYRFNSKEKKPDLRHACYGTRGEKMVCLELDVPDEKVLLSDFDLWHFVLNDWWLDTSVFKDGFTEKEYDQNHEWFKTLSEEEQRREKERSWEIIFNIEPFDSDWIAKGQYVQAVFWELKKEYVRKAQFFTAR
jgi:hypothetical protein